MTKTSIVITSYNTKDLLKDCLSSVYKNTPKNTQVIIVDNASDDSSVNMVKKSFPKARLIKNSHNLGFSKANNQGINQSQTKYIMLLNSDTIFKENAIDKIENFMDSNPRVGIASPVLLNPDGSIQPNGGSLPRLSNLAAWSWFIDDLPFVNKLFCPYHQKSNNFFSKTQSIGWVSGAAMILRKQALDKIGLLDEKIFMYGEDVDLCIRAKQKGWDVYTISTAHVIHQGHASGDKTKAVIGEYQSLKYLFNKHKPKWEIPILSFLLKSGSLARMLLFGKIIPNKSLYEAYHQAYKLA